MTFKARGTSLYRNRVKRLIREAFRKAADQLGAFDYNVVIPASKKLDRSFTERLAKTLPRDLSNVRAPA
jgi:ribonuclease P protein component